MYSQSNGMSEKAVQTVKRIIKKAEDLYIGLPEYHNTPVTGMKYSPLQLLLSRVARTKIPLAKELLQPEVPVNIHQQLKKQQKWQKENYHKGASYHHLELEKVSTYVKVIFGYQQLYPNSSLPQDHMSSQLWMVNNSTVQAELP